MINIASQTRNNIKYSLDNRYYARSMRSFGNTKGKKSIQNLFARLKENVSTKAIIVGSQNSQSDKVAKCFASKEYFQQQLQTDQQSATKWLLFHLISQMDKPAQEISNLINDSFALFDCHTIENNTIFYIIHKP